MVSWEKLDRIMEAIRNENVSILDVVCALISGSNDSQTLFGPAQAERFILCAPAGLHKMFSILLATPDTCPTMSHLARNVSTREYLDEISKLLPKSAGFHFNTSHATTAQFDEFSSIKMAKNLKETCPLLWTLFGSLLNAVSMSKASHKLTQKGDYLTNVSFEASLSQQTPAKEKARTTGNQETIISTNEDMPDDDWGYSSIEFDSSDDDSAFGGQMDRPMDAPLVNQVTERSDVGPSLQIDGKLAMQQLRISKGAPWRKDSRNAAERQMQRTMVVSTPSRGYSLKQQLIYTLHRDKLRYLVSAC
jgi:hypothetical protein